MINYFMCAVSLIAGIAIMYVLIASYILALPAYKSDVKMAKLAKKLGYAG